MLWKSRPKISDAAPKWFTKDAVFSNHYCGLYSLHTKAQKPVEPLKLSEKLWRWSPNLSTTIFYKMVEKVTKWRHRDRSHIYIFLQSVKQGKLLRKSHNKIEVCRTITYISVTMTKIMVVFWKQVSSCWFKKELKEINQVRRFLNLLRKTLS